MPLLVAAVVLVGLLGLLNLLLTMAVIRRLREHTTELARLARPAPLPELLPVGSPLPALTGESIDGEAVTSEASPPHLLAFLSTTCGACTDQLPELVRFVRALNLPRSAAIVAILGPDNAEGQHLMDVLRPVATVLREPIDGPIATAFSASVFPAFYLVANGVVEASAVSVARLPQPVRPA